MGYTTDFDGWFDITPPLSQVHADYLRCFSDSRRMQRNPKKTAKLPDLLRELAALPLGPDSCYYIGAVKTDDEWTLPDFGQSNSNDIIDYNKPPAGQPGLWCQWTPGPDSTLVWDEGEKFYDYVEWLRYLIQHFFVPWSYTLNGDVTWQGEDPDDQGKIVVTDNVIKTQHRSDEWIDD